MPKFDATAIQVGTRLPDLVFGPVTRQVLALYAGASGDHNPIHIDTDYARQAGLDDVFAHGMLSMAQIGRTVTEWCGAERLSQLSTRFSAITPVGAMVTCRGEVTELLDHNDQPHCRVALTATLEDGTVTLIADALIHTE